jgi:hypothetical protein
MFGGATVDENVGFVHDNPCWILADRIVSAAFSLGVSVGLGAGVSHVGKMMGLVFDGVGGVLGRCFSGVGSVGVLTSGLVNLKLVDYPTPIDAGRSLAVSKSVAFDLATETNDFGVVKRLLK